MMNAKTTAVLRQIIAEIDRLYVLEQTRKNVLRIGFRGSRKRVWTPFYASEFDKQDMRAAQNAVKRARLKRSPTCELCRLECSTPAYHYKGYEEEHWLAVPFL